MGYTGGSSSSGNVTKEVKFVKAKDPVVADLTGEKLEVEEKKNVVNQRMLNPRNQSGVGLNLVPSHAHDHKEVLDQLMCVIIADFKGILDQIAKS